MSSHCGSCYGWTAHDEHNQDVRSSNSALGAASAVTLVNIFLKSVKFASDLIDLAACLANTASSFLFII